MALEGQSNVDTRTHAHDLKYQRNKDGQFWVIYEGFKFGDISIQNHVFKLISQYGIGVIIIDTLSFSRPAGTLNDDGAASIVTRELREYGSHGVSVILIGHSGKVSSKGLFGSQVFQNDVPTLLKVTAKKNDLNGKLTVDKQRSAKAGTTINYKLEPVEINEKGETAICVVKSEGEKESHDTKVFNALSDLLEESNNGVTRKSIQNYIGSLDPDESKNEKISKSLITMINRSIKSLTDKNRIIRLETEMETLFKIPDSTRKQVETNDTD
jgi:hypothetical protein